MESCTTSGVADRSDTGPGTVCIKIKVVTNTYLHKVSHHPAVSPQLVDHCMVQSLQH